MALLAIETSCDETCAAVMADGRLLSSVVASQEIHRQYGGVVPELASRAHLRQITAVVRTALERANVQPRELQALAVTQGPGLIGSLLVGISFAKGMACDLGVPLLGVNHLEGHLFSTNIDPHGPQPPLLSLIVSGGHTILVYIRAWGDYQVVGETQDDAAGEAFDKVARILDLPYPGGPQIEKLASRGDPDAFRFPVARLKHAPCDFSFSGLKTAVLYQARKLLPPPENGRPPAPVEAEHEALRADLAAAFQHALITALVTTTARAHERWPVTAVSLAGGVACNQSLRAALVELGRNRGFQVHYPPPIYCTDNAAMIARAAAFHLQARTIPGVRLPAGPFDLQPQPGLKFATAKILETA